MPGISLSVGLAGGLRPPPVFSLDDLAPGALGFAYDFREGMPLAVGGGAISDGATAGSLPGRAGSPTLASASGKELTFWAGRRGGRAVLQGAAGKWLLGAANITACTRIFVVAEVRWQDLVRGAVEPPAAFASGGDYPGLAGLGQNATAAAIATGFATTNHFLRPEDFGGQAISLTVDGTASTGLDVGQLDRVLRVFEFSRASGWSGAPLVLGDDRNLGISGRQWLGTIVAAVGLTSSATNDEIAAVRADLLAYHQGGSCVGFIGDSITAGWGLAPVLSYRGLLHTAWKGTVGCPTISIPGGTIPQLAAQDYTAFDAILRRSAHPVLSVALAANDLGTEPYLVDGGNPHTALANLTALIAARKASIGSKLKVILHTLTARSDVNLDVADWPGRKAVFDAGIRANFAAMGGVSYADHAADPLVGDPYNAAGFLDGVHPTTSGHSAMKARLQPLIEAQLPA
jgi:lysophospholipase L1-like esterase